MGGGRRRGQRAAEQGQVAVLAQELGQLTQVEPAFMPASPAAVPGNGENDDDQREFGKRGNSAQVDAVSSADVVRHGNQDSESSHEAGRQRGRAKNSGIVSRQSVGPAIVGTEPVEQVAVRVFGQAGGAGNHLLPFFPRRLLEIRNAPRSNAKAAAGDKIAKDTEDPAWIEVRLLLGKIGMAEVETVLAVFAIGKARG